MWDIILYITIGTIGFIGLATYLDNRKPDPYSNESLKNLDDIVGE